MFDSVKSITNPDPRPEEHAPTTHDSLFDMQPEATPELVETCPETALVGRHGVVFFSKVRANPSAMQVPHMAPKIEDSGAFAVAHLPICEIERESRVRVAVESVDGTASKETYLLTPRCMSLDDVQEALKRLEATNVGRAEMGSVVKQAVADRDLN